MRLRLSVLLATAVTVALVSCGPSRRGASSTRSEDVIVLYESDVHCGVDGYTQFKALKDSLLRDHNHVVVVSCGDFAQGGSLGAATHGGDIVKIMNEVGYDFVALGNHEFDYGLERQKELVDMLDAEVLCSNFRDLRTGSVVYKPYAIRNFGGFDVAFVGLLTPLTMKSTSPKTFMDADGKFIYDFGVNSFYADVQRTVDAARADGAEYVVVLSHIGDNDEGVDGLNSLQMIASTSGIDAVLDGHAHSVIPAMTVKNIKGQDVVLTAPGTKFAYMGCMTLSADGRFETKLIPTKDFKGHDNAVDRVVAGIRDGYRKVSETVVCHSDVALPITDPDGKRLVRSGESPLGNFCTDAYRTVYDTDIAMLGGGSFRDGLPEGDITFNDIYTMFPFENTSCKVDMTGELLLDVLEFSISAWPDEFGGFLQVSGVRFDFDPSVPTPVKCDANRIYTGVEGPRRIRNAEVYDRAEGVWKAVEKSRIYSVATSTFLARDHGDGYSMMSDVTGITDFGVLDTDVLRQYMDDFIGRHVTDRYAAPEGRINVLK